MDERMDVPPEPTWADRVREIATEFLEWMLQPDGRRAEWWEYALVAGTVVLIAFLTM